jgi:glycosyltransferase involved in cell wall biosynthesis
MRIALVHEWFVDWAGSEKVVEQILACFPNADLFALVDFLPADRRAALQGKTVTTSFLQHAPLIRRAFEKYLPLMPLAIEQLDLSSYDLIISSSHAVAKGVITSPDQLHVSYVHSPMRYAWDLQGDYLLGAAGRGMTGWALRWTLHYLRLWDTRTSNSVDAFAANSRFIARRIWKIYRREATIVHPPVDLQGFAIRDTKENFYVCVSRLMPYKRVDLIVEAFGRMPDKRLVVLGAGPEAKRLKRMATTNVEFLGYQEDSVVIGYLQSARALIFAAKEDFGIVPVEAQACGTPVIAYGAGGVLDTVLPLESASAPTGLFFHQQTSASIVEAVSRFEESYHRFQPQACRSNAERFSPERFRNEFSALVERALGMRDA